MSGNFDCLVESFVLTNVVAIFDVFATALCRAFFCTALLTEEDDDDDSDANLAL